MDLGVAQQPKQQIQQIHSPAGPMQARSVDARTGVVHSPTPPLMQSWFRMQFSMNRTSHWRLTTDRNTMGSGMHTFIPHTPIQQQARASIPSLSDRTLNYFVLEVDINLIAFIRIILGQRVYCPGSTTGVNYCWTNSTREWGHQQNPVRGRWARKNSGGAYRKFKTWNQSEISEQPVYVIDETISRWWSCCQRESSGPERQYDKEFIAVGQR